MQCRMINNLQISEIKTFKCLYEKIFYDNCAPYIMLETNLTKRPLKMLVDTGASLSIVSSHVIENSLPFRDTKFNLYGFGSASAGVQTRGIIDATATINNCDVGISLHVIDKTWGSPADGFLGFDFLTKNKAHIDMECSKIYFKLQEITNDKDVVNKVVAETQFEIHNNNEIIDQKILDEDDLTISNNHESDINEIENKAEYGSPTELGKGKPKKARKSKSINTLSDRILKEFNEKFDQLNQNIHNLNKKYDAYIEAVSFHTNELEGRDDMKVKSIEVKSNGENENEIIYNQNYIYEENENYYSQDVIDYTPNENNSCHSFNSNIEKITEFINEFNQNGAYAHNLNQFDRQNEILPDDWGGTITSNIFTSNNLDPTIADRITAIHNKLNLSHCSDEEAHFAKFVCGEFPFQFYLDGDNLTCTNVIKHHIKIIPGSKTVNVRQYRIPHAHKTVLFDIIQDYEKQGLIERCQSNYNSPAILVAKKDDNNEKNDFRFVVDYRKLNEISEIQNFPIPLIDDILDGLNGCTYFTTLDIKGAFHQIMLDANSRDYTAFTAGHFQYRWIRMPMGLSSAPLTWQRAINTILHDLIGKGVYVYLDDVIIYGKSFFEHNKTLCHVMLLLRDHGLQLKISKCNFYAKQFDYLGYIISKDGLKPNPRKVQVIGEFPRPKNTRQIQSFLGMINYYRRFIKDFAKLAKPLTILCKQDQPFIWTETTQISFDKLKQILCNDIILSLPDFTQLFYVTTDASDVAIGAVLSQGELPYDRPIHFFSRTLNEAQRRYSTIQKELLAIVEAIKNFRPYLYGRFFVLITDHKPLCYLFNMKDCGSRLFRQRLDLLDYNFKILYRPGAQNTVADALSRIEPLSIEEMLEIERRNGEIHALTRAQAQKEIEGANNIGFTFEERDGTILNKNNFDLIFHLIPTENDVLKNKLVDKFGITQFPHDKWMEFRNFHHAILVSNQFSHSDNTQITNSLILDIVEISRGANSIAVNIDFDSLRHYIYLKSLFHENFKSTDISITFFLNKIVELIERGDIDKTLDLYHKSVLGGHFGADKMFKTISKFYKWNNMVQDIKNFVTNCETCKRTKFTTNTKMPMQISSLGEVLFDHTYMDFVGPIAPQGPEGHKYIFTATCDLTKYMIAVPTMDCSALTTAECLLQHVLLKYNFPSRLISDNASNFNSKVIQELTKILNVKKIFSTPYHPQSNIVERGHRTLNAYLRAFTAKNRDAWHELLKFAMFAYNNSVHSTTGYTPHELAHGFKIKIPNNLFKPKTTYNYDNLADFIRNNIANSLELAKEHLYNRKMANKAQYDKNLKPIEIKTGDFVYVKTQNKSEKFQDVYEGPFEVLDSYDNYVEIKRDRKRQKIHKNLTKRFNNTVFPNVNLDTSNFVSFWNELKY